MKKNLTHIYQTALQLHRNGDLNAAESKYKQFIKEDGTYAPAHNNLGVLLLKKQKLQLALACFKKALTVDKNNALYEANLGITYSKLNKKQHAFKALKLSLSHGNVDREAFILFIKNGLEIGETSEVIKLISTLGNIDINEILVHAYLISYSTDTSSNPLLQNSLNALAVHFSSSNSLDSQLQILAIREPYQHEDCLFLSLLLKFIDIGFYDITIDYMLSILPKATCSSELAMYYALQGIGQVRLGNNIESIHHLESALEKDPKNIFILSHLSSSYALTGNFSSALYLTKKYKLPTMIAVWDALNKGDFDSAWSAYRSSPNHKVRPNPPLPELEKSTIKGKSILVFRDQGIGDEIMYLGCLSDLLECQPKKVIIECSPRIEYFLKRSFPSVELIPVDPSDKSISEFSWLAERCDIDACIRTSFLPSIFRKNRQSFMKSRSSGYLLPNQSLSKLWRGRLSVLPKKYKVGFAWKGGVNFKRGIHHENLHLLQHIFNITDIAWVNMQYGDIEFEKRFFKDTFNTQIHTWNDIDYTNDLEHIGALAGELDLIIQINNTSLHLAGATGSNVWAMLLHGSFDARWFLTEDPYECLWYPNVRLFRQNENQTLESLIKTVAYALNEWVSRDD